MARDTTALRLRSGLGALASSAVLALGAGLLTAAGAAADGDPASDTLLGADVFYPYSPPVSGPLERALNRATARSAAAGAPIKIAIIASPLDLGVIPALFGKPQSYAEYLDQEISFTHRAPLLVVMPTGYGVEGLPPAGRAAAARLPRPAGRDGDALARAALTGVVRIAAAEGHPLPGSGAAVGATGSGSGSDSGGAVVLVLLLGAGACVLAAAGLILRRRDSA